MASEPTTCPANSHAAPAIGAGGERTITPILLDDRSDYIHRELWRWLCDGRVAGWKEVIGRSGRGLGSPEAMMDAWAELLEAERSQPAHAEEASRILDRLRHHREEIEAHRACYRFVSPDVARHRYWPTGKREGLERDQLYEMSLCPRPYPMIDLQTKIAAAGNCFAMNLGRKLREWGYDYFIKEAGPPHLSPEERWERKYGHYSVRQGILFNTPSLRQWAERGLGLIELQPFLWRQNGQWFDPYREEVPFDSPEEFANDLPVFLARLRETLVETDVLILAPSNNEVWQFRHDGSCLSRVPWKMSPALLERRVLSVEENLVELQRLRDVLADHNPGLQIIMTVSPVPLLATFRSEEANVVTANCHGKSVLRVAAEEFARRNANVVYFPGYEAVTFCCREPFMADGRHIHPDAIERTARMFREMFCKE